MALSSKNNMSIEDRAKNDPDFAHVLAKLFFDDLSLYEAMETSRKGMEQKFQDDAMARSIRAGLSISKPSIVKSNDGKRVYTNRDEDRKKIIAVLRTCDETNGLTRAEIAEKAGIIPDSDMSQLLSNLSDKRIIRGEGATKSRRWFYNT